jgi:Lrp/AsnC family leucine-responsive transcriptional regulator
LAALELDEFDRRLLAALQRDNRQTGEALAEQVGLSPAACLRRAQRLRESGVIERDISIVAAVYADRPLTLITQVTLQRDRPDYLDTFRRRMIAAPEVTQAYYVTGAADLVLVIAVGHMEEYEAFTRRQFGDPQVKRFDTMVVMNRVKFETATPIKE